MQQVGIITEPKTIADAQFSTPFNIAMRIVKVGNGFFDYTEENLQDPNIIALANRIRLEVDDEVEAIYPRRRAVRVTIKLKDGNTCVERLEGVKGSPANPMTNTEIKDKFRDLSTVVLPYGQVEEIIKVVEGLDTNSNISTLCRLLSA